MYLQEGTVDTAEVFCFTQKAAHSILMTFYKGNSLEKWDMFKHLPSQMDAETEIYIV